MFLCEKILKCCEMNLENSGSNRVICDIPTKIEGMSSFPLETPRLVERGLSSVSMMLMVLEERDASNDTGRLTPESHGYK